MKSINHQPKAMVLAIALALGFATLAAGCSQDHDDMGKTAAAPDTAVAGNMDAVTEDSTQPVDDTLITTKVKAALATMGGVDNTAVGVETSNGIVTLTGAATSQTSADAMAAAAMRVQGVTKVNTMGLRIGAALNNGVNDDVVEGDGRAANDESMDAVTQNSHAPVKDTWITTKVLAKLQAVDGLDNTDLAVETSNGIVTLSGHAGSQAKIDAAVAAAKTIEGVKDVHTSLLKVGTDADR